MALLLTVALPVIIYLPLILVSDCGQSEPAYYLQRAIASHVEQQRPLLVCDDRLVAAAQKRASTVAHAGALAHCDQAGICANVYARVEGCMLPSTYGDGNEVESLGSGTKDWRVMLKALLGSPSHRDHLLGVGDFFRAQTRIGVALVDDTWAILIADCQ